MRFVYLLLIIANMSLAGFDENIGNEVLWENEFVVVDGDVISPLTECPGSLRGSIPYNRVSNPINEYLFEFSESDSGNLWNINVKVECSFKDMASEECALWDRRKEHLPKTMFYLSCLKYEGITVGRGDNGEVIIKSDIPGQQDIIDKHLNKDKSNSEALDDGE